MALERVIGTETEYGIMIRNKADFNPAVASALIVNSYRGDRAKVRWSFEEESPGRDARGFGFSGGVSAESEDIVGNVVLSNGARLYVDHAHPEYSSPECADPLEATLYDKAGELIMHLASESAREILREDQTVLLAKNNSDGKGNSYGFHENYLMERLTPFDDVISFLPTFLVSRQIFTGAGKVGSENGRPATTFQITQRADFFEELVGLETTLKRPIINTRDEPHGTASKYRRLHVIIGDANLSEIQTFLKLGTTSLFLAALEDRALPDPLRLADPVEACWQVSHDLDLSRSLRLETGGTATAIELQMQYVEWLTKYAEGAELPESYQLVFEHWVRILDDLERDPSATSDRLDWMAKHRLMDGFVKRDGIAWESSKLKALDIQYHDVHPERSLYRRLVDRGAMQRLVDDDQVSAAVTSPPEGTRAYFRGRCVAKFSESLVAANWDSLVFDTGEESLKRVPMMEPLRGDRKSVGGLLDQAASAAELLDALGGDDA